MTSITSKYTFAVGRAAAAAVAVETFVFAVVLLWEALSSMNNTVCRILGYVASLILAPSVLTMMACFYDILQQDDSDLKIFGLLALLFSVAYVPFCASSYFLQLSIVEWNDDNSAMGLPCAVVETVRFKPGYPVFALDMLGYCFLCLATLAAGFALPAAKDHVLRALCFFHGALIIPAQSPSYLNSEDRFIPFFCRCIEIIPIKNLK